MPEEEKIKLQEELSWLEHELGKCLEMQEIFINLSRGTSKAINDEYVLMWLDMDYSQEQIRTFSELATERLNSMNKRIVSSGHLLESTSEQLLKVNERIAQITQKIKCTKVFLDEDISLKLNN